MSAVASAIAVAAVAQPNRVDLVGHPVVPSRQFIKDIFIKATSEIIKYSESGITYYRVRKIVPTIDSHGNSLGIKICSFTTPNLKFAMSIYQQPIFITQKTITHALPLGKR